MAEELKATAVDEFLRDRRKVIELPTGKRVEIRQLNAGDFLDMITLPTNTPETPMEKMEREAKKFKKEDYTVFWTYKEQIICKGVLLPKIVMGKAIDKCEKDELHVSYLTSEEINFLHEAILNFNGMGKEGEKKIEPFREEKKVSDIGHPDKKIQSAKASPSVA